MKTVVGEIVLVGDELLNGTTADVNGKWLGEKLSARGIEVVRISMVGDGEESIVSLLEQIKAEVVIITGGLGPTEDDITKASLAKFFSAPLEASEVAKKMVVDNYTGKGHRQVPASNRYHIIPGVYSFAQSSRFGHWTGKIRRGKSFGLSSGGSPGDEGHGRKELWPILASHFPSLPPPPTKVVISTHTVREEGIFSVLCPNLWRELAKWGKVSSLPQEKGVINIIVQLKDSAEGGRVEEIIRSSPLRDYISQIVQK